MDIEVLSPSYYREDRIAVTVDPKLPLLASRPVVVSFDYAGCLPQGVVLPIVVAVQPAFGDGSNYVRKVFRRVAPSSYSFVPREAGDYLVTVRESAHNRWQGRLIVRVGGDSVDRQSLGTA